MSKEYCCEQMKVILDIQPPEGKNLFESGNTVLCYDDKFDEYGLIIHDGGQSYITLNYCPWCSKKLPLSKRDAWFNKMEEMGIEPFEDDIPEDYKTSEWWKKDLNIDD